MYSNFKLFYPTRRCCHRLLSVLRSICSSLCSNVIWSSLDNLTAANPVFWLAMMTFEQWFLRTKDVPFTEPSHVYTCLPKSAQEWLHKDGALLAEPQCRWNNFPVQDTEELCLKKAFEAQGVYMDLNMFAEAHSLYKIDVKLAKEFGLVLYKKVPKSYMLVKAGNSWFKDSERVSIPQACYTMYPASSANFLNQNRLN